MNRNKWINILLGSIIAVTLFHLAVIIKLIPYDIAWGGRLQSDQEMYVFESISILINLFFGLVLLMKGSYVDFRFKERTINNILWVYFSLFILNTIGNLFAKTSFEKSFALVTLIFAIFIWKILNTNSSAPIENVKQNEQL